MKNVVSTTRPEAAGEKPAIFILHPSDLLTDHRVNGDGLIAFGFLKELSERGYRLHVAYRNKDVRHAFPANVTFHQIHQTDWAGPLGRVEYMVRSRLLLRRLRRDHSIDIIHQMNPVYAGLSLGMIGCGIPVLLGTYVARWPDAKARGLATRMARWVRRGICFLQQSQAAALMLTTPAAMDRIAAPAQSAHKIVPMQHGIDAMLFSPSDAPPVRGPASILFYTSVAREKGIFVLIEAFGKVLQARPEARLSIVGKSDDWPAVDRVLDQLPYRNRIDTSGFLARNEAPQLMRDHAIYCLPSFGEPYGTTAMEAMACGRPVVVTNTGGLPDMVSPDGAIRVPQGDPDALASALIELIASPERQQRMGQVNRAYVENYYTWPKVVNQLEGVYAELVTAKQPVAMAPAR